MIGALEANLKEKARFSSTFNTSSTKFATKFTQLGTNLHNLQQIYLTMVNQRLLNQLLQANFLNSIWKNRHKFTKMANHLTFCFFTLNVFQINPNCQLISAAKKMRTVPHCTCATTGDGKKLFSPFFSAKSFHSVILQID